jgi:hypothetical protein
LQAAASKLASFSERQRTVAKETYEALEQRYAVQPAAAAGEGGSR